MEGWACVLFYGVAAVLAGAYIPIARRALLVAGLLVVGVYSALLLGDVLFSTPPTRFGVTNGSIFIGVGILATIAVLLRVYTNTNALALVLALLLFELFLALVIAYTYGCPSFVAAVGYEHRQYFLHQLSSWLSEQRWYIVTPWLVGAGLGEVFAYLRTTLQSGKPS